MLTKDEHSAKIQEILTNVSDPAKVSILLTELAENYGATIAEKAATDALNEDLMDKNTKLKDTNLALFLKIPAIKPEKDDDNSDEKDVEGLTYEDLFNEEGRLK